MKNVFYAVLLILVGTSLFAQTPDIKSYLKEKGYVPLTDTANLPKSMMPYYKTIMDTINYKYPEMKSFYVLTKSVEENKDYFYAIFYPLSGIILTKKYADIEVKNEADYIKRSKDTSIKQNYLVIDSMGGSVGEFILRLNKATHRMLFYQTQ